jgi:hypothetical protein
MTLEQENNLLCARFEYVHGTLQRMRKDGYPDEDEERKQKLFAEQCRILERLQERNAALWHVLSPNEHWDEIEPNCHWANQCHGKHSGTCPKRPSEPDPPLLSMDDA